MNASQLGQWGEDLAATHLEQAGHRIVARNWRCEYGEIDLVTRHHAVWVFVEVKTRRSQKFGSPQEAITSSKQRHLIDSARTYLAEHELDDVDWRIDIVAIFVPPGDLSPEVEIFQNAVSAW